MSSRKDHPSHNSSDDLFSPTYSKRRRTLSDSEASSSSSDPVSAFVQNSLQIELGSEDEAEIDEDQNQKTYWDIPQNKQANISFSGSCGISSACDPKILNYTEPHSFYFLFATDEIFEIIAAQTNIYAAQIKSEQQSHRLDKWSETNVNEIKRFFGLIIWMGLVRLPQIHLYWSTSEEYNQTFPRKIMSRNRFELLLRFIHFNNEKNDPNNRLCKLIEIINILNGNFKKYYNPEEVLCVDELLMPVRRPIKFNQDSKQKCGIKVLKLSDRTGYTYSLRIYTGKEENTSQVLRCGSSAVVLSLCEEILGKGHTICTDDRYTSVELAEKLIDKYTHLVGTLSKNRRGNPQEVINQKLKRGEVIGRENEKGVTVLKWKDKRDVVMLLSTKHSTEMTTVNKKWYSYDKPKAVVEYNLGKVSADLSDHMIAYSSPLRRTVKWYKKLAMELLLNTCITNALVMFKQITHRNIQTYDFAMKIAIYLTKCKDSETNDSNDCLSSRTSSLKNRCHELKKMPGKAGVTRRLCKACYEKNSKSLGRLKAKSCTKKVTTYCGDCTGSPFLCLDCFNAKHRN